MTEKKETTKGGLNGIILSHKMAKTAIVKISRYEKHPKYGKYIVKDKKYKAHDEKDEYKEGDKVIIMPCRPISKEKHFIIVGKIQ